MSATVLTTFSVLKDHVKLKVAQDAAAVDNLVFRLHYRVTFVLLLIGSLLVTSKQFFGEHIKCSLDNEKDSKLSPVIDTFCFFSTTFTITKYMNPKVDYNHVPHPGVGPYTGEEEIVHHAYYQWVPFVLFFQAIAFYVPHYLWRGAEGGRLKALVSGLHMACLSIREEKTKINEEKTIPSKSEKDEKIQKIRDYFLSHLHVNRTWAYYLALCELLNFINVILQIYITNWFLGGAFFNLGINVMKYDDWTSIVTPLDVVFPKVTKCIFHKYGPSGTVEQYDALCIMALNIVNEKIYTFLWFWYIILTFVTGIAIVWRIVTMFLYSRSVRFNRILFSMACPGKEHPWAALHVIREYHFGDWLFLYYIAKNLDNYAFAELLGQLAQDRENRRAYRYPSHFLALDEEDRTYKRV